MTEQDVLKLRATLAALDKEHERLKLDMQRWDALISEKQKIVLELKGTVAELQKPDGLREGLVRCIAEYKSRQVGLQESRDMS